MPDNSFEREVLDRLIKIETKLESWDNSKKQIYDNRSEIIHLHEQTEQQQRDIDELRDRSRLKHSRVSIKIINIETEKKH